MYSSAVDGERVPPTRSASAASSSPTVGTIAFSAALAAPTTPDGGAGPNTLRVRGERGGAREEDGARAAAAARGRAASGASTRLRRRHARTPARRRKERNVPAAVATRSIGPKLASL